jgi:hypothetical protein
MINVIFSSFRKKGKYIIYILLLFIISCFYLLIIGIDNYYSYNINEVLGKKDVNRGLVIYNSNVDIFIESNISLNIYRNYDLLMGSNNLEENDVIISKFYFNILNLEENDIVSNKKIKYKINNKSIVLNIVGVTSNNKTNIYVSESLFNKISDEYPTSYYVLVDSYKNVLKVQDYLLEHGIDSELYDTSGLLEIEKLEKDRQLFKYVLYVSLISLFIVLYMIIKNIFLSEEKNIAILKAIGYKTKDICLIILSRVLILMICSYILNVLLCLILFQFNNYILLFVLINIFILVINSLIYYKKIKDMNVLLILNGD